jgi:transmembrane sensor
MTEPLARYVRPHLTEARVARQWRNIDSRSLPAPAARYRLAALAVALCAVALVAIVFRGRDRALDGGMEGSVIEDGTVTLVDGSRVAVTEGGRVRVERMRADAVVLTLDAGAVELAVPHTRRTLVVRTPLYDVVDVGTRFRVVLDADGGERVDVSEGQVEIRSRAGKTTVRLVAGDSWSSMPSSPHAVSLAPSTVEPSPSGLVATAATAATAPAEPASSAPIHDANVGPKELLEIGQRARLAGQPRTAGAAFDTLRRRFRSDPRAALAAFELGRLRLDILGDAPGAVEAFDDAIALAPRGPLREDAEARRVEALGAERSPQCPAARDAFLARYPASAHAAVVTGQCRE